MERLKPAPIWNTTAIDLFGPFKIRDEVHEKTLFFESATVLFSVA